jgi:hypothetical protein
MNIISYPFKVLSSPFKNFFKNQLIQLARDDNEFRGALRGPTGPPGKTIENNTINDLRTGNFNQVLANADGVFELTFDPPFQNTPIINITAVDVETSYTILSIDTESVWIEANNFIPIVVSDNETVTVPNTINANWGGPSNNTPNISSVKHNQKIWTAFAKNGNHLSLSSSLDTIGAVWNEDPTVDLGIATACRPFLISVDNILHIFYVDTEDENLYWMFASDETATSFSETTSILNGPIKTYTAASITQNGLASPAILASQAGEGDYLVYMRLSNEPQPSWSNAINVINNLGIRNYYHFSLCDVSGEPAFTVQSYDDRLYYYRSLDGEGFDDFDSFLVDGDEGSGAGNHLSFANGVPVISYYKYFDDNQTSVFCTTALDCRGYNGWNEPVELIASTSIVRDLIVNGSTFVSEFFGRLIVCYYLDGVINQQQSLDRFGNQWFDPFTIVEDNVLGSFSVQFSDLNNCPVIIYSQLDDEDTSVGSGFSFPIPLVSFNWLATELTEAI